MLIDLYQLTMAQAYWHSGHTATATFSLYFRTLPASRGYQVFAGLEDALDFLEGLAFGPDDLGYLESRGDFTPEFLDFLADLRFTGSVRAMAEGTPCFPEEPVMEVTGPVIEAQLVETYLLNQVNLQTALATKASRVVGAARGRSVVDFAARRVHGTDAALKMARVGFLAGFDGTSNVEAAQRYGIPAAGTMAHSFVTSFESEIEAFRAFVRAFPHSATLLVDTYDTLDGVRAAVTVAHEAAATGGRVAAIRLDSGDLNHLAHAARALLDGAGLTGVKIVASGGLDEHSVDRLVAGGAPIDVFGVGTAVGTSADAPATDCVYKMVEYDGRPVAKLSADKGNLPGPKQVYRRTNADADERRYGGDSMCRSDEPAPDDRAWTPLIREVMVAGSRIAESPSLPALRGRFDDEISGLPDDVKRLTRPSTYPVAVSAKLRALADATVPSPGRYSEERIDEDHARRI